MDEDSVRYQQERIRRIALKIYPECEVEFNHHIPRLNFCVFENSFPGTPLAQCKCGLVPGTLSDKDDAWVDAHIRSHAGKAEPVLKI